MDVVARSHDTEDDPFLESDACMELQNLLEKTMPNLSRDVSLQNICVVKKKFQCVLIWMGKTGMLTS